MAQIEVKSEVTGSVWEIRVKRGDPVAEGDVLMVIESMKMEIPVVAIDTGTIAEILIKEGAAVSESQPIAILTV